jgi:hypothetical protein
MAILTRLAATLLVAAGLASLAARPAAAQDTIEHEVRAAFLYNFVKFVDWPHHGLSGDTFRVCVLGDMRVTLALDGLLAGETVGGRLLVREEVPTLDAARNCQLLYIGRQEAARTPQLLEAVRDLPVLTVGDAPRFLEQGGTVRFLLEQDRVRFDVHLGAVERSGLSMSSKLLRVARRVEGLRR